MKYQIIYADPPWAYRNMGNIQATASSHYPTMENEAICKLPIKDLADDNCILFLWATFPKLQEALDQIGSGYGKVIARLYSMEIDAALLEDYEEEIDYEDPFFAAMKKPGKE